MRFVLLYAILITTILIPASVSSQDISQSSLSSFNIYRNNAAYGGFTRKTSLFANVRSQWVDHAGAPRYRYIGVHSPVYTWQGAIGLDLESSSYGGWSRSTMRASYNFVKPTSFGLLSLGGRVGLVRHQFDEDSFVTPEGEYMDGVIVHNDPLIAGLVPLLGPTYDISLFFQYPLFQVGLSLHDFATASKDESSTHRRLSFLLRQKSSLSQSVDLLTFMSVRTNFIDLQTDFNMVLRVNGNVFGGVGVRGYSSSSLDAVLLTFGHQINDRFSIMYGYDAGLSKLRQTNQGTHELMLRVDFDKLFGTGLPPAVIHNPRYL